MNQVTRSEISALIDPRTIKTYCDVVFGYLDGLVPIRLLSEKGTPQQQPEVPFVPVGEVSARLASAAPYAAARRRAVYVVPGTVEAPGSARKEDICQTGVLLVDLDHGDIATAKKHLARHLVPPTLVIASGGVTEDGQEKLHLYWRLTEAAIGTDLGRVAGLRRSLAEKVGGDTSFGSIHQPIRVAGTVHGKNGRLTPTRILDECPLEYDLGDLADAIASMPALIAPRSPRLQINTGVSSPSARDLATRIVREGGQDEITRFKALSKVCGHWISNARRGECSLDEAWGSVVNHNAAMIRPPWPEERLRREFEAILRKDIAEKGQMAEAATEGPLHPPGSSEDAIAASFTALEASDWRHTAAWGRWFYWNGACWRHDETGRVREAMRLTCRRAAAQADSQAHARRIASDKTIAGTLRIASADPRIATAPDAWDRYPMLLNTPSGLIDLGTGEIRPHDRDMLITQMTAASPGTGCPTWEAFLEDITGGDHQLKAYLARFAGYCLTGSTEEQVFAFLHGSGANGKSVFITTLAAVLGDYAKTATLDTFLAARSDRHLTELAGLHAARMVIVPEVEAGRTWAEGRIKTITGGEPIRANFMRQDHFEFVPGFKLVVAGNHRPGLANVGEAMRRRLHLVPFDVTIPAAKRDPKLASKLRQEADGILGWMLAGCREWQQRGLAPPPAVDAAVEDYFASEDLLALWIAEQCIVDPTALAPASALYTSWKSWAETNGHPPGTGKSFGEALRSRGHQPRKVRGARGWHGLALRSPGNSAEART